MPVILGRSVTFAVLWLVIAGADPGAWVIGVPAVALATLASLRLAPLGRPGLSPMGVLGFLPYFLWQSLLGGLDVASRVLRPRMRIDPGFLEYPLRLTDPRAQVFFLDVISLLPGTLSADVKDGMIEVHALDLSADLAPEIADLERRVARIFNQETRAEETRAHVD